MRKISGITICVALIFFSVIHFLNYSYYQGYSPLFESVPITVNQNENQNISNKQYVGLLESAAADNNIELMYVNKSIENNKTKLDYYVTANSKLTNQIETMEESFNYPSIFNEATVQEFSKIDKYTLTNIQLYALGDSGSIDNFVAEMSDKVADIYTLDLTYMILPPFQNFYITMLMLLMYMVLLFVFIFLQISKSKDFAIKKLNGYSLGNSLLDELKRFNRYLILPFVICVVLIVVLFKFNVDNYLNYLPSQLYFYFKYLVLLNLYFICTFLIIYYKSGISDLKGRFFGKKFVIFINLTKLGLILLLILSFGQFTNSLKKYESSKEKYEQVEGTTDYSTLGVYTPNMFYDPDSDLAFAETITSNMEQFYVDTINELDGILGYFIKPEESGIYISNVVNRRYLEYNPVVDINGNTVDPSKLAVDKLIYLVPEKYKGNSEVMAKIEAREALECPERECLQVIYVKDGTDYRMISQLNMGETVTDPIVQVMTPETSEQFDNFQVMANDLMSFISSGSYIVRTNQDDPYKVVLPYIQKTHLENLIQEAPLLTNDRLKIYIQNRNMLIIYSLFVAIVVAALLIGSYFLIKTEINSSVKKFSLKYVDGQSENSLLRNKFLKIGIIYTIAIIVSALLPLLNDQIIMGGRFKIDELNTFSVSVILLLLSLMVFEMLCYKVLFKCDVVRKLSKNINGGSR